MKSSLANAVDGMLRSQSTGWPLLAENLASLRAAHTRGERAFGRDVLVRHIPHRIGSTTAAVDAASVAARSCFLCPESLYPDQRGVPFGDAFMVYANPFPILDRHLTVVHRDHRPQRIAGQFHVMLELAAALPDSFVLYNGPACGASAPDHLHFQSCSRAVFPIERDAVDEDFVPRAFVLRGDDAPLLAGRLNGLFNVLSGIAPADPEPMLNVVAYRSDLTWTAIVFPRGKHRPRVFQTGELTVSPASIDLCGVFVVPVPADFQKIRGADIEIVLEEVTLPRPAYNEVLRRLGGRL